MTLINGESASRHGDSLRPSHDLSTYAFGPLSIFTVLLCLSAANFFRIGCQLVITAWSAVQITGHAESVGHVLLISSAANLVFSPLIGALVDRCEHKKQLVLAGHFGVALCGASPLALHFVLPQTPPFALLVVATLLSSLSGIVLTCSMDYFVKLAITPNERTRKLALTNSVSQITLIAGTSFGGYLISQAAWRDAFLLISCYGLLLTVLSGSLLPSLTLKQTRHRNQRRFGLTLYLKHHHLFLIACCSALAFAVGQVTNTLLPAFMSLDLRLSGQSYSLVEAAWSIGALCASTALVKIGKNQPCPLYYDLFIVLVIAGLLSVVPWLSTLSTLVVIHLALGVGFASVRVRAEARFLTECPIHLLARFRANSLFLSSSISAVVFITPTLYRDFGAPALYQLLSGAIAASAIALIVFARPWRAQRPASCGR